VPHSGAQDFACQGAQVATPVRGKSNPIPPQKRHSSACHPAIPCNHAVLGGDRKNNNRELSIEALAIRRPDPSLLLPSGHRHNFSHLPPYRSCLRLHRLLGSCALSWPIKIPTPPSPCSPSSAPSAGPPPILSAPTTHHGPCPSSLSSAFSPSIPPKLSGSPSPSQLSSSPRSLSGLTSAARHAPAG